MANSFLPSTDAGVLDWARNFSTLINATPTEFGLDAAKASEFEAFFDAYEAAYNTAIEPITRTKGAVAAKNTAKNKMLANARLLASIVQGQADVTDQQKINLGLTVRAEPSPIPPPTHAPEIDFMPTATRTVRIRLHNEHIFGPGGRPPGVAGASIFHYIGANPPSDISEWNFIMNTTKTVIDINLPPSVESGTLVWFTAYWRNPRDQSGPATTPISTVVQYGGLSQAA